MSHLELPRHVSPGMMDVFFFSAGQSFAPKWVLPFPLQLWTASGWGDNANTGGPHGT